MRRVSVSSNRGNDVVEYCKRNSFGLSLITFLVIFFGIIVWNGFESNRHVEAFTKVCEQRGGVVKGLRPAKGWPKPVCMNPEAFVEIGEQQ